MFNVESSPVPLGANGHASHAFVLAENYHDFRSLASLCHKGTTYPPEDNPNAHQIQSYIEKFKDEFTTELYQWYIEHGQRTTKLKNVALYSVYESQENCASCSLKISTVDTWINSLPSITIQLSHGSMILAEESMGLHRRPFWLNPRVQAICRLNMYV
jgi:hypothetical protein